MKVGIMQPYFMPYIGYWQLINVVDNFVLLDDVNYITRGYINRNNILVNGKSYRFTIPIEKASQNKLIMETKLNFTQSKKQDFLMTIQNAYSKAPYYKKIMPLIEDIINNKEMDLTAFIKASIEKIMEYLNIHTKLLISSKIQKNQELKGEERIIEICKRLGADTYINPCGGRNLYHHKDFQLENLKLFFLYTRSEDIIYKQKQQEFIHNLSIIDIMMFNNICTIQDFLEMYELNN